jgi:hypothetical protein
MVEGFVAGGYRGGRGGIGGNDSGRRRNGWARRGGAVRRGEGGEEPLEGELGRAEG